MKVQVRNMYQENHTLQKYQAKELYVSELLLSAIVFKFYIKHTYPSKQPFQTDLN